MLRRYTAIKPSDIHDAIEKAKPASPAPDKAGQQGDGQGDSTTLPV